MASKILLRLIDEAIIPAIIVVVAKILAVVFLVQVLSLNWHFTSQSLIPSIVFDDSEVGFFVNSYSNLFLFLIVLAGFGWVLAKAYHFHENHVSPRFVLRLLSLNLSKLLTSSDEVYHQGLIWASYMWLVVLMIGVHTVIGVNFVWIFILVLVIAVFATGLFIADIEREIGGTAGAK